MGRSTQVQAACVKPAKDMEERRKDAPACPCGARPGRAGSWTPYRPGGTYAWVCVLWVIAAPAAALKAACAATVAWWSLGAGNNQKGFSPPSPTYLLDRGREAKGLFTPSTPSTCLFVDLLGQEEQALVVPEETRLGEERVRVLALEGGGDAGLVPGGGCSSQSSKTSMNAHTVHAKCRVSMMITTKYALGVEEGEEEAFKVENPGEGARVRAFEFVCFWERVVVGCLVEAHVGQGVRSPTKQRPPRRYLNTHPSPRR